MTKTWKELGFKNVPETQVQVEKGTELFEKLSDAEQEKILGKAAFQAYKSGAVKLEDFIGQSRDKRWGTMRHVRSLRDILGDKETKKWMTEAVKAERMKDEPNKLIKAFLNPKRDPTEEEVRKILNHVAKAPFRSTMTSVKKEIQGQVFLGQKLRPKEPSITAHLAKRVLAEGQWSRDTTLDQYLADLRSVLDDPKLRKAVYQSKDGRTLLGLLGQNRLPRERLGDSSESFIWVLYSADYGTIVSGYQVSGVNRITLPKDVRWL
ncbi:MAG: hypothetical protein M1358_00785 [Chloroflexi bacterium]|nr:hypothetical protein [Chloroflexota bacterium]